MHAANNANTAACVEDPLTHISTGITGLSFGITTQPIQFDPLFQNLVVSHQACQQVSTMSTSPVDPLKTPRVDNDKVDPPLGAYKRSSKDCLPVAIPDYTLEANAAALLVSEEDFDSAIAHTIRSSRILTAWVAFQMAHTDAEDSRTISKWRVLSTTPLPIVSNCGTLSTGPTLSCTSRPWISHA